MADATFENKILVSIGGSEEAAAKLRDIITVQREGMRLGDEELKKGRESLSQVNLQFRAINALARSWQMAHPQLALLTRGFSNLATIARSVLSLITSISVAQMAQAQRANQRREIEAEINFLTKQKFDLISQGFADTDPKIVDLNKQLGILNNRLSEGKAQGFADQLTNITLAISAVLIALGSIRNVMATITAFRLALSASAIAATAFWSSLLALGALIVLTKDQFDDLLKTLGLFDIVQEIDKSWQDFKNDWKEIFELLPKYVYIAAIRVVKFFTDMWDKLFSIISTIGEKVKKGFSDFWGYITKGFQNLWKTIVGGSIWPDMFDEMQDVTKTKLGDIKSEFMSFNSEIVGALIGTGDSFMSAVKGGAGSLAGAASSLKSSIDQLVSVQQASNALSNIDRYIAALQQRLSTPFGFTITDEALAEKEALRKQMEEAQKKRDELVSFATGAAGITMSQFNTLPIGLKEELMGQGIMSQSGRDVTGQGLVPGKILQIVTDNVTGGQHTQFSAVRPGRTEAETRFLEETNMMGGRRSSTDIPTGPISRNPAVIQIINNIGGSVVTERELSKKIAESIARDTQGLIR